MFVGGCNNKQLSLESQQGIGTTYYSNSNDQNNNIIGEEMIEYKIDYLPDENAPFYETYEELINKLRGNTGAVPTNLSKDDFCAYYSYKGNDTEHVKCLIVNDGNFLMAYKIKALGGDDETFAGVLTGEDSFIKEMRSLPHVLPEETGDEDGANENYGYLFFKQDGKVVLFNTKNIFENEE